MPSISPSGTQVYANVPLTNFSQYVVGETTMYGALRGTPMVPVAKQSGQYYKYSASDFIRNEDTSRAPGTAPKSGGFDVNRDNNYFSEVKSFRSAITEEDMANEDTAVQLRRTKTEFVMHKIMNDAERAAAGQFFVDNVFYNGTAAPTTAQNVNWSAASSNPIQDVRNAKRGVQVASGGLRPNRVMAGRQAADTLLDNEELVSRINGGSTVVQPGLMEEALLARMLEVESVTIMDAVQNSGIEGGTDSNSLVFGDSLLLYYAPTAMGLGSASAIANFSWTGLQGVSGAGTAVRTYNDPDPGKRTEWVEGNAVYDFRVIGPELGWLFGTVSS